MSFQFQTQYAFYFSFALMLSACSEKAEEGIAHADFSHLTSIGQSEVEEETGVLGGLGKKKIPLYDSDKVEWSIKDDGLHLQFEEDGSFQFTPKTVGLPVFWKTRKSLDWEVYSQEEGILIVKIYGSRSFLSDTLMLKKGLNHHQQDIREAILLGGLNARPLYIKISSPSQLEVTISSLKILTDPEPSFVIDRWGQRALKTWDGKIKSFSELKNSLSHEDAYLDNLSTFPSEKDGFGGFSDHPFTFQATGFFHTEKVGERWFLVTPKGNPFFSIGLNGVRMKSFRGNADVSRLEGREEMFESIPTYAECPECFREDSTYFSYYCWNVKQKYANRLAWKEQVYQRMETLGFNTIGNWSDTLFYQQPAATYTYTLDTRRDKSLMMQNGLPDVFHPDWEQHLLQAFAEISRFKDDPYLLGYFVDNEIHWRSLLKEKDSTSYTFQELNNFPSDEAYQQAYAEQYFSTIQSAIGRYDPNHLYLGCRFTRNFEGLAPIAKAAGEFIDVLSVNIYSAHPIREETDNWYNAAQKPILIGEHHIPPSTPKQLPPHYGGFPDEKRYPMIENYVLTWATYPYALGCHWYQFKDQEVAGRGNGGENQPVGLVTVTDQLNRDMAKTYHRISSRLDTLLFNR